MNKLFSSKWMQFLSIFCILGCIILGIISFLSPNESLPSTPKMDEIGSEVNENLPHTPLPQILETNNILKNPGFETSIEPWTWLSWSKGWSPYKLSRSLAYEGNYSLHLPLTSKGDNRSTVVWGGVQEPILQADIPECVEGYYYVDNWQRGNWKQYLQLVIIDLSHDAGVGGGQSQLRYIITGEKEPPLSISNAQYLFIEKDRLTTPVLRKWTKFHVNPRADFQREWNYVPSSSHKLRILFEARFDAHKPNTSLAQADVFFDNLYMGPKTATRCAD